MKQTQKTILLLITLAFMIFTTGCEIYDCDAATTEIATLQENFIASITIANCTEYADKVNEYVDEGCGTSENENTNCEEIVCSIHASYMLIYVLTMAFSFDSTEYCTYYDSLGMTMQELVNAGGCASDSLLDVAVT